MVQENFLHKEFTENGNLLRIFTNVLRILNIPFSFKILSNCGADFTVSIKILFGIKISLMALKMY